jgi:hypothetical protein
MIIETSQKVTASQLKRSAFLYIRQSTPRQVLEHSESTAASTPYGNAPSLSGGRMSRSL